MPEWPVDGPDGKKVSARIWVDPPTREEHRELPNDRATKGQHYATAHIVAMKATDEQGNRLFRVGSVAVATSINPASANLDHETVYGTTTGDLNFSFGSATDWLGPSASVTVNAADFIAVIGSGSTHYFCLRACNGVGTGSHWVGPQTLAV